MSHAAPRMLRRAEADDAASVAACAVEAFRRYIPRLALAQCTRVFLRKPLR
jgi:hypothetical protein